MRIGDIITGIWGKVRKNGGFFGLEAGKSSLHNLGQINGIYEKSQIILKIILR